MGKGFGRTSENQVEMEETGAGQGAHNMVASKIWKNHSNPRQAHLEDVITNLMDIYNEYKKMAKNLTGEKQTIDQCYEVYKTLEINVN